VDRTGSTGTMAPHTGGAQFLWRTHASKALGRSQTAAREPANAGTGGCRTGRLRQVGREGPTSNLAPRTRSSANLAPRETGGAFGPRADGNSGINEIDAGFSCPLLYTSRRLARKPASENCLAYRDFPRQNGRVTTLGAVTRRKPQWGCPGTPTGASQGPWCGCCLEHRRARGRAFATPMASVACSANPRAGAAAPFLLSPLHACKLPGCDAAPHASLRASSGSNSHCRMLWLALSCHLSPRHHVIHGSHPAGGCFAFGNGQAVALRQSSSMGSTLCWQCLAVGDVKCERVTVSSVKMQSGMVTTL
jgi:hypothetical protein